MVLRAKKPCCTFCQKEAGDGSDFLCPVCGGAVHEGCGTEPFDLDCPKYGCRGSLLPAEWSAAQQYQLLCVAAGADGKLNEDESRVLRKHAGTLGLSAEKARELLQGAARGGQVSLELPKNRRASRAVVRGLADVVVADGVVTDKERVLIEKMVVLAGLPVERAASSIQLAESRRDAPKRRRQKRRGSRVPDHLIVIAGVGVAFSAALAFVFGSSERAQPDSDYEQAIQRYEKEARALSVKYPSQDSPETRALRRRLLDELTGVRRKGASEESERPPGLGKVLPLNRSRRRVVDLFDFLPADLRPESLEEVGTLALFGESSDGEIEVELVRYGSEETVGRLVIPKTTTIVGVPADYRSGAPDFRDMDEIRASSSTQEYVVEHTPEEIYARIIDHLLELRAQDPEPEEEED